MTISGRKPSNPPENPEGTSANDNGAPGVSDAASRPQWPVWSPAATVRITEAEPVVRVSRRPSFVSHPPPPPDPGALLLDSLALDYESPRRYAKPSHATTEDAEIGRGGIGRVSLLVDQHLGREVALKELLPETRAQQPLASTIRLLAEARITGQLEHPNIVPVYDLGRRKDGRLYYTMRVIRGETLAHALEEAPSLARRIELLPHVARACNAIAYAHSRGIIHRDIKPDNIMIGEFGETVVLDWGIAKLRDAPVSQGRTTPRGIAQLSSTDAGELVGTPLYMSPEQASGEHDLDETTDVWSLGVLMYVVLSGRLPFDGSTFDSVRDSILRGRPTPLRDLEPALPPELVTIVERALARNKRDRYSNAKHLAGDLDAYMSGARVLAHQYTALDLVLRFFRRHRAAAWVALTAACVLVAVAGLLQNRILRERDRAIAAEKVALDKEHVARSSLAEFYADRARAAIGRSDLPGALMYAARSLAENPTPRARGLVVALTGQEMWLPAQDVASTEPLPLSERSLTWQGSNAVVTAPSGNAANVSLDESVSTGVLSRDGSLAALGGRNGSLHLWWPDTNRTLATAGHRGTVVALAFSDDRELLVSAGLDRSIHFWNTATAQAEFPPLTDLGQTTALHLDATSSRLFVATHEHELFEVDIRDPSRMSRIATTAEPVTDIIEVTPQSLVVQTTTGPLAWSKTNRTVNPSFFHLSNVLALDYLAPDRIAAAGLARDGVCIWDLVRDSCVTRLPIPSEQVRALSYAPNTHRLAVGMSNGQVMIWNGQTLLPQTVLSGPKSATRGLQFEPDGVHLLAANLDGSIARWSTETGQRLWTATSAHGIHDLALDPDGSTAWYATRGGTLEERALDGRLLRTSKVTDEWVLAVAVSRPLHAVFATTGDGGLAQIDSRTLEVAGRHSAHSGRALSVELSPDDQLLATAGEDGLVVLWSTQPLQPIAQLVHHKGAVRTLRFSEGARYLASAGDDRSIRVWDLTRLLTPPSTLLSEVSRETGLPPVPSTSNMGELR